MPPLPPRARLRRHKAISVSHVQYAGGRVHTNARLNTNKELNRAFVGKSTVILFIKDQIQRL